MTEDNLPKILLSAVGLTDPISNYHDGAIMHLARAKLPNKIVLIFSQSMLKYEDDIRTALASIPDYNPEIEVYKDKIKDADVNQFDTIFEFMSQVVDDYYDDDVKLILNLSSGTPQMKSALFTLNRIKEYNGSAYQVATPLREPTVKNKEEKSPKLSIEEAIATNKDNLTTDFYRISEDKGENFTKSLIIRNLTTLLNHYDYQAFYTLLLEVNGKKSGIFKNNRKKLNRWSENLANVFRFQEQPSQELLALAGVDFENMPENQRKALAFLILIDVQRKRNMIADVLIKMKSLTEFMLESYLEREYPGLISKDGTGRPYLNKDHDQFDEINKVLQEDFKKSLGENYDSSRPYNPYAMLNLLSYATIIRYLEANQKSLFDAINYIEGFNGVRNKVAHGLVALDNKQLGRKHLDEIIQALSTIYRHVYQTEDIPLDLYDRINAEIIELLK